MRNKINSFVCGVAAALAATIWSALYDVSGWELLIVAAAGIALQFVPTHRLWQSETVLMAIAVGAAMSGGCDLLFAVFADISHRMWWIGWLLLTLLLCYVGRGAVYRGGLTLGILAAAGAVFSLVGGLCQYDGGVQGGSLSRYAILSGILIVWGCTVVGRRLAEHPGIARIGTITGCVLLAFVTATPLLLWGEAAMAILPLPLVSAWKQIGGEVWMVSLFALTALWMGSGGILCILQDIKTHSFTNKI